MALTLRAPLPLPLTETMKMEKFIHGEKVPCPFSTITAAFYHHVQYNPHSTAARDFSSISPRETTYSELGLRVQQLARHLHHDLGVGPGDRVPLVVKRNTEMLVGIFAILSCGAQYVPLDGGVVPDTTLRVVLEQTGAKVALCLTSTVKRLETLGPELGCQVVDINTLANECSRRDDSEAFLDLAAADFGCYIIYTSGTTGSPKGVDVTHKNVTNLVCLSPGNLDIHPGVKVGQVLNISFDMAAWEILGCLSNGGTLIIRGSDWSQTLNEIDTLISTPGIVSQYTPEQYPNIRTVANAGEPSWQSLADRWASHGTYFCCCGPTETTIVNTMSKHVPGQPLSIGRPTPNNTVYILGPDLTPVSLGSVGVMWAGGLGVSAGYVGLPDLSAEKYKLDIFASDGSMMYNTGDFGRFRADGQIDILGRVDDQVKIKGFRVELDGVAASMNAAPGVSRAVTLLIDDEIQGFVTPLTCDPDVICDHLKTCQPYYAMPSHIQVVDHLPQTSNGKIDKVALRAFAEQARRTSSAAEWTKSERLGLEFSDSSVSTLGKDEEKFDLARDIAAKALPQPLRGLIHRVFIPYRSLFSIVGLTNIIAIVCILVYGLPRNLLGTMTATNLTLAVLIRQDFVINALYTVFCSVPKSWPLWIRASCGKIYHLGGIHSSAAISAAMWLLASNISDVVCGSTTICSDSQRQSPATTVISWLLIGGFCIMITLAYPTIRKAHHDLFERTHRFLGWTMLALFWIQTILATNDARAPSTTLGSAAISSPNLWLLLVSTSSIITPWLFLRKVPVESEVLSSHAIRLHFDYTVPVNGSFTRLSFRPLIEWHSFATIPAPEPANSHAKGYSLIVSNAGDWTAHCIARAPREVWVRGVPTCGVMRIATLFGRVVVVATGSGIGPCLGHIQARPEDTKVIWSTRTPEETFGRELVGAIRTSVPDAVIHDTKTQGRPDLVRMAFNLARASEAEAVIVIANEKITKKIVYGLETRGMNCYGAVWDS